MPDHSTPSTALSSSSSSSSRPPSVLNLHCREQLLVESPPAPANGRDIGTTPSTTVSTAATALLSSPNASCNNNIGADGSGVVDAADIVVVAPPTPPTRYYLPFGQNANELSMERKRLLRVSLHAQQQQQHHFLDGIGGGRWHRGSGAQLEEEEDIADGGRDNNNSVFQQLNQQGLISLATAAEVPKGGAKILASIDTNIPTNGARLASSNGSSQSAHQRTYETPISSNGRSNGGRMVLRPVTVNEDTAAANSNNNITNMTVQSNRKRRAAEEEEDRRLNEKERLWVCADVDRAVHLDPRPLQALLQAEKSVTVSEAQIRHEQRVNCGGGGARDEPGIEEWARAKAVEWMHEVCEADHADFVVLPLAVAYLDRMLACRFVPRRNLQALASGCLLLASKMRAPQPMSAQRMAEHTDNSVRMEELLDWEMLVLNHLQWNLLQSTPFEFFDQLLVRCPVLEALREDFALTLHRTQKVLRLATQLPSVQAAATLLFVALRTRKKHLLVESEQAIRRNLGIDPMNTLVPLFGPIEGALDGLLPANGAETQRQYAQSVEEERWQLAAIQPPSSKRMSLGTLSGNVPSQQSLCYSRLSFLFH
ncbi:hypothetical protein niasHS_005562 [Heterodera schachtii]|uniref:Cyclin-like domain-containing protein n=1 Tax=Heterodera schachtii TaxID=97005 RepID=A0ABD2JYZ5_HETSC